MNSTTTKSVSSFRDWRNRNEIAVPVAPPKNYIPNPLPSTEPKEKPVACWHTYPTDEGCEIIEEKAGGRSWIHPPRVNATRWYPTENRDYWDQSRTLPEYPIEARIAALNDDVKTLGWNNQETARNQRRWRDCALICTLLQLTPYQRLRVHYLLSQLTLNEIGLEVETVAFILAALVCREDGRQFTRHPSSKSEDPIFDRIARGLGLRDKLIRSWLKKLPQRHEISHLFNNRPKRDVPPPVPT